MGTKQNVADVKEAQLSPAAGVDVAVLEYDVYEQAKHLDATPEDLEKANIFAATITTEEANAILHDFLEAHGTDMLIPRAITDRIRNIYERLNVTEKTDPDLAATARLEAALVHSNSVYREVRAVYPPEDDVDEPCGTIRAWFIGLFLALGLAAINQFFSPRNPAISVAVYLAQMIAYPAGLFCARFLPTRIFWAGSRFEFTLNPGLFSLKEHMLITIMSNVTSSTPYITNLLMTQQLPVFLGQTWARSWGYQICMILSTQLLGFSLAGLSRRFIVYPSNMIWYFNLSQGMLNKTLHNLDNPVANGWRISRFKFFFVVFGCMFCYFWLPNTIFPTLTFFNWITWIRPQNAALSIITGSYYFNLGLNPFASFDWNWFGSKFDPTVIPSVFLLQMVLSMFVWAVCVIIPVFFTNTFYSAYMPINSWFAYDNQGHHYQIGKVVDENFQLIQANYEAYSPVFLPASSTLRYGAMFGILSATMVFAALYFGKTIIATCKYALRRDNQYAGQKVVHSRAMSKYKEVPEWIYAGIGVFSASLAFAGFYGWPTETPGWLIPLAFFLSLIFVIPIGIVAAVTSYFTNLEIIFQVIGGYVCRGNPLGYMLFKAYGHGVTDQALFFAQDMKLGHYAHVPPRQMLSAQVVSTVLCSFVSLAILNWQVTSIPDLCNSDTQIHWTCGTIEQDFASALQWAVVGSKRLFAPHTGLYNPLLYAFLAGAIWPVPFYIANRKWPNSWIRHAHPILLMIGTVLWSPLNFSMIFQSLPLSWFFGTFLKKRFLPWWSKYCYVLSCALSTGIAVSAIVQFIAIENPGVVIPDWWGTTQYASTCDFQGCTWLTLAKGEKFGPAEWH